MIWKYGKYEWDWKRERPTQIKFNKWKQEYLELPEIKDYEVWLSGGFLEKWDTWDIDITLIGPYRPKEIKHLLYTGIDLGIKKYNMFVDITYQVTPKYIQKFCENMSPNIVKKIALGNLLSQNNKVLSFSPYGRRINSELSVRYDIYPKEKHLTKKYKNNPIRLTT